MRIKLLIKITSVVLVLLGLSLRSAVSAGGSDEEVFPPKTLEKLKKNYSTQQKKSKSTSAGDGNREVKKSEEKESPISKIFFIDQTSLRTSLRIEYLLRCR